MHAVLLLLLLFLLHYSCSHHHRCCRLPSTSSVSRASPHVQALPSQHAWLPCAQQVSPAAAKWQQQLFVKPCNCRCTLLCDQCHLLYQLDPAAQNSLLIPARCTVANGLGNGSVACAATQARAMRPAASARMPVLCWQCDDTWTYAYQHQLRPSTVALQLHLRPRLGTH